MVWLRILDKYSKNDAGLAYQGFDVLLIYISYANGIKGPKCRKRLILGNGARYGKR